MALNLNTVLVQALLGFVSTAGFAILFNVPRRALLICALIGTLGHGLRFVLISLGVVPEVATFCGSLCVGLVGAWPAHKLNLPRIVFTVTGIIDLVPGIPAYQVLVYFSRNDIAGGLESAVKAGLITGAIVAGLSTARILTDRQWSRSDSTHA
ncbi:threonine/serine exporter family protein [Leptolyngbya sp. FACHB-261]|uniref:threonine/serine exporter family protein n=1 Tax=Leptolyngbya sp. FACHB-261 TaxID=2692806 RepID=UPI001683C764|nr:threonine/serine exporter family protein [Leptolyngbya sp. FACHB-261]MBD2101809.1 threonine/serine exporter family protein [Leptolyngbya sp. FACHB-261]